MNGTESGRDLLRAARLSLDEVGDRLRDVERNPTYRLLSTTATWGPATAAEASSVAQDMSLTWRNYLSAKDHLDRLETETSGRTVTPWQRNKFLRDELSEPTVSMHATHSVGEPKTSAGSVPTDRARIADVLATASSALDRVSHVVARVDTAFGSNQPALETASTRLIEACAAAAASHIKLSTVTRQTRDNIAAAVAKVRVDPLSLSSVEAIDLVEAADRAATDLAVAVDMRVGFRDRADSLRADLASLTSTLTRIKSDIATAQREVVLDRDFATDATQCADRVSRLLSELDEAETHADVDWNATQRRLQGIAQAARDCELEVRAMDRDLAAQRDRRREMRGLLGAYRAKASALKLTEDPDLESQYAAAEDELYAPECNLDRALELVEAYRVSIDAAMRVRP